MNIYIDCSRVYVFGGNYGIPRVVRNIINNTVNIKTYKVTPIIFSFGKIKKINRVPLRSEKILYLSKKIRALFTNINSKSILSDSKNIKTDSLIIYNLLTLITIFNKTIKIEKGDIFVTLDNFAMLAFPEYLMSIKNKGVIIASLQHDLITLRYSQLYPPEDVVRFTKHLENSLKLSDICITVSDYVKNDLENYIKEKAVILDINKNIKISSYRHGYDIDNVKTETNTNGNLRNIFTVPTYIIVSTIEPRKNHKYLLDAFDIIWNQGIRVNLLIIGKIGWMVDQIITRIKNHEQFGKQLFMINNMSDTELLYCYKNAKALITPSITEGFGLPIIEALSQKTPVLASDIPVFKEVGKDFCSYFDISDPNNLAQLIIRWERDHREPNHRKINEFEWPTWRESAEELINKIIYLNTDLLCQ